MIVAIGKQKDQLIHKPVGAKVKDVCGGEKKNPDFILFFNNNLSHVLKLENLYVNETKWHKEKDKVSFFFLFFLKEA